MVEIEKEAFGDAALSKWELVPIIIHGKLFVLYKDDRPIGSLELMLDWENPKKAYIYALSIRKKYQGQGYGTKLIEKGLYYLANKKQIETVELTVDPENKPAVHIYKNKLGFEKTDIRNNFYGRGIDRWVMELNIKNYEEKEIETEKVEIAS